MNSMTTGSTPGIGSFEGRKADDGWCLFITLVDGSRAEHYGLTWAGMRQLLVNMGMLYA